MNENLDRLKTENARLRLAVEELSILNEIATAIASTLDLNKIIDLIIHKSLKHLKIEQAAVLLLDEKDKKTTLHTMVRKEDSGISNLPFRLDAQLTGWMLKNKKALLSNDLQKDSRFKVKNTDAQIRSVLAVPLLLKGHMIGVIAGFNKRDDKGFDENDQRLFSIIAAQSAQTIENARLYKEEQAYLKIQQELRLARQIQLNLLPEKVPLIKNYDLAAINIPAKEVGGDYFDFISLGDRLAFCVGDVSGKGIPAALLMANLQATLRNQVLQTSSVVECIKNVNRFLYHATDTEKYATLFLGILDLKDNRFNFCNAGHNNPFLISKGGAVSRIQTKGIVIGFLEDFDFTDQSLLMKEGDTLIIFSDGISEAMNMNEEEFEEARLLEVVEQNRDLSMKELIDKIVKSVNDYAGLMEQFDDMTLLCIRRIE